LPFSREIILVVVSVIVIVAVISIVALTFLSQTIQPSSTVSSGTSSYTSSTTPLTESIKSESKTSSRTGESGVKQSLYSIKVELYVRDPNPVETSRGILKVIIAMIEVKTKPPVNVYIDEILVDNLTSDHPLYTNLTYKPSVEERFVGGGSRKIYVLKAYITDEHPELLRDWRPQTEHKIYVVLTVSGEQKIEIYRVKALSTTETMPWEYK